MRSREEIQEETTRTILAMPRKETETFMVAMLEVLLDIRELLINQKES